MASHVTRLLCLLRLNNVRMPSLRIVMLYATVFSHIPSLENMHPLMSPTPTRRAGYCSRSTNQLLNGFLTPSCHLNCNEG
jgi:hypothetical protein